MRKPHSCYIFLAIIGISFFGKVGAQDIHFSQNTRTPLLVNPSLAGSPDSKLRFFMNYRDQWRSIAYPFKTMAASLDMNFSKGKSAKGFLGAGLSFYSDKAGDSQMGLTRGDLTISYKAIIDQQNTFAAGIQGGIAQHAINTSKLTWASQYDGEAYDPSLSSGEDLVGSRTFVDLSGGLSWTYKKDRNFTGNAGISMYHLNRPEYSFLGSADDRLLRKFILHVDALIKIENTNVSLAPDIFYSRQSSAQELTFGSMLRINKREASKFTGFVKEINLWYGLHYRFADAVIASLEFSQYFYSVRFSYDVNVSFLQKASDYKGGFEISIKLISPESFYYTK